MNAEIDITNVVLKTERLVLREWKITDLDDFYEYAKSEEVGPMAGWTPHKDKNESKEILQHFIDGKHVFALEYNGKVIGSLGIEKYDEKELSGPIYDNRLGREIGYVLSKDYWGMGLMPEAVKRVINYCFNDLKLDFLACGYFLRNNRSKRVQEKCGFKPIKVIKYETRYNTVEDSMVSILENNKNL